MAHEHIVVDTDIHFTIDENTRMISIASGQTKVMQGDHNSEQITFELPRMIDSHDMMQCNEVQVHYINVGAKGDQISADVYDVADLQVSPDDESKVTFTWTVGRNATLYAGLLNFAIKFKCIADDGTVEYVWGTEIYKDFTVGESLDIGAAITEQYPDILEEWEARLDALESRSSEPALLGQITISTSNATITSAKDISFGDSLKAEVEAIFAKVRNLVKPVLLETELAGCVSRMSAAYASASAALGSVENIHGMFGNMATVTASLYLYVVTGTSLVTNHAEIIGAIQMGMPLTVKFYTA